MEATSQSQDGESEPEQSGGESSALTSVSRGAGLFLGGKIGDNALRLIINLLLTHGLGATYFGIYSYGYVIMSLIDRITNLGTDTSVLKFIPQYDDQQTKQNQILGLATLTSLVGSLAISGLLYFSAPYINAYTLHNPLLTDVLQILAIVVPFTTMSNLLQMVFKAIERPEYQVLILNVATPLLQLVCIAIPLALGYELKGATAGSVAAGIVAFLFALGLFVSKTSFRPELRGARNEATEFYNYSLPLTLSQAGAILGNRIDLLMIGIFIADGSAVGIYKVALVVAGMLVLPLSAFNQIFPPVASRLYSSGEIEELQSLYKQITRWIFSVALFLALAVIIYAKEILVIFGDAYTKGSFIIVLFALGQLANAAVGPSGYLLMMTEHQYLSMVNRWAVGILNVVGNYIFIQEFGLVGAALATALVLFVTNLARVVEVWYTERLFPYSYRFVKPLVAGLASAIVMYGLGRVLSGYVLLVFGGLAGFCAFAVVLFAIGIEEEDREFFDLCLSYATGSS